MKNMKEAIQVAQGSIRSQAMIGINLAFRIPFVKQIEKRVTVLWRVENRCSTANRDQSSWPALSLELPTRT
jgi:hypothetical protein